jgi:DNA end-binding protein Ku
LKALVKRKAAGKTIEPTEQPAREGNVVDLMDALRRSLGSGRKKQTAQKHKPSATKPPRRRAA